VRKINALQRQTRTAGFPLRGGYCATVFWLRFVRFDLIPGVTRPLFCASASPIICWEIKLTTADGRGQKVLMQMLISQSSAVLCVYLRFPFYAFTNAGARMV